MNESPRHVRYDYLEIKSADYENLIKQISDGLLKGARYCELTSDKFKQILASALPSLLEGNDQIKAASITELRIANDNIDAVINLDLGLFGGIAKIALNFQNDAAGRLTLSNKEPIIEAGRLARGRVKEKIDKRKDDLRDSVYIAKMLKGNLNKELKRISSTQISNIILEIIDSVVRISLNPQDGELTAPKLSDLPPIMPARQATAQVISQPATAPRSPRPQPPLPSPASSNPTQRIARAPVPPLPAPVRVEPVTPAPAPAPAPAPLTSTIETVTLDSTQSLSEFKPKNGFDLSFMKF